MIHLAYFALGSVCTFTVLGWAYIIREERRWRADVIDRDIYGDVEPEPVYPHPKDLAAEASDGGRLPLAWEDWKSWTPIISNDTESWG